ncbi:hypothetical protein CEQ90_19785 [Lewinellaceae bacterium SD302]|nr:hypothetical protein CEQ90_19785 [Lewinellaceae bacterium SD302]
MNKILAFFKRDDLWTKIVAGLTVAAIVWIFSFLFDITKGISLNESLSRAINILNYPVKTWHLIISLLVVFLINSMFYDRKIKRINKSLEEVNSAKLNHKIDQKLDKTVFNRFEDVYNYRRLKSHPLHDQYSDNNIESFMDILDNGVKKNNSYKINNAIEGLCLEINIRGWLHANDKDRIIKQLKKVAIEVNEHHKENLLRIIDEIKIV